RRAPACGAGAGGRVREAEVVGVSCFVAELDSSRRHSGSRANASPESITTAGDMDSGPAPYGASRNDGMKHRSHTTTTSSSHFEVAQIQGDAHATRIHRTGHHGRESGVQSAEG